MKRQPWQRTDRVGLTIIELMVALSVCVVIVTLLVPAVQQARETSREAECRSRLRQIGIAIHGFAGSHQSLPAVAAELEGSRRRANDATPPHVALLPWLEQSALADEIAAFSSVAARSEPDDIADATLKRLLSTPLAAFRCPSDDGPGLNNMVFCLGPDPVAGPDPKSGYWGTGPFPLVGSLPLARVTDGLSQTAAVGEKLTGSGDPQRFDRRRDYWYSGADAVLTGTGQWPPARELAVAVCDAVSDQPVRTGVHSGWSWAAGRYNGACYNHAVTPNADHTDCTMQAWSPQRMTVLHGVFRATSQHRGGVNQLMLDGSVRFLSDAVSADVYRALATRADAEIVSAESF